MTFSQPISGKNSEVNKIVMRSFSNTCPLELTLNCRFRRSFTWSAKYLFFEKCFKKILNIFSNFFFYLKMQSFRLKMENNFIQMAASAGHAVATRSVQFLSALPIVCSCISKMASRILSFKASIVSGLSA